MAKPKHTNVNVEVSPQMLALLRIIANVQNGVLQEIIIRNGEPVVVKAGVQRIDFEREDELEAALKIGGLDKLIPIPFGQQSAG